MDEFEDRKYLPPLKSEEEDMEVEKMTESDLGRIRDVPLPYPRKTEGQELCRLISRDMK